MNIEEGRLTLRQEYADCITGAGGLLFLIPLSGSPGAYAEVVDGLLIPGGDDLNPSCYGEAAAPGLKLVPEKRSEFEINLVREIIRLRKPLLGICYGMQLVNVALGGNLYQDIKGGTVDHRERHEVEVKEGGPVQPGIYMVNSTHHQAVKTPGRGLEVLAFSRDGLVEALYMKDYPFLLCVQWHPEREQRSPAGQSLSEVIFNLFVRSCGGK